MRLTGWTAALLLLGVTNLFAAEPWDGVIADLKSGDPAKQAVAAEQAAEWGPLAVATVPALVEALNSKDLVVRYEAANALGKIGSGAAAGIPALRKLTESPDVLLRHAAWNALRGMGTASKVAAADLPRGLKDADPLVRIAATHAELVWQSQSPEQHQPLFEQLTADLLQSRAQRHAAAEVLRDAGAAALPALLATLKAPSVQQDPALQTALVDLIGMTGAAARTHVPAVLAAVKTNTVANATALARALGRIGGDDPTTLAKLQELARHEAPAVRTTAMHALEGFPQASKSTVPQLVTGLSDRETMVRLAALDTLAFYGPTAVEALPAIDKALGDAEGAVTIRAAETLVQIGSAAAPVLAKRLDDPQYGPLALQSLGMLGVAGKSAAPQVVAKLAQPGKLDLRELCLTLAFLQPDPQVAGPALQKIAQDAKSPARPAALYALGRIGDRSAERLITNTIEDADPNVQIAAAWALLQLDPKNADYVKVALPKVAQALERPDPRVRREAAGTLRQLGAAAASAAPKLVERLRTEDDASVRLACILAVAEMGEGARPAVPAIAALLSDPAPVARRGALYSLGRLGAVATAALPQVKAAALNGHSAEQTIAIWAALRISQNQAELERMLPILLQRIPQESPEIVVELLQLLGEGGQSRPEILTFLKSQAESTDPTISAAAKQALQKLKP